MNNELVTYPSWWKRNWKWVVPVGGCFTLIIIFVLFIGTIFYGVTSMLEGSLPYEYALEKINEDEELTAQLGKPIVKDGMVQGNLNYLNGDGKADMKIPISGPNGSGILYIKASSINEEWTYQEIRVEIKDNEDIDLLEEESEMF